MFFHVFRLMVQWAIDNKLQPLIFQSFPIISELYSLCSLNRRKHIQLCFQKHLNYLKKHQRMKPVHFLIFFHVFGLMVQWPIDLLALFFDVFSCNLIDGPMVHWPIDFILWYSFMHYDWWFNGPLTFWLHSLMFFHVFRLMFQWDIDVLAPFFDILLCISIDGSIAHWLIGFIFSVFSCNSIEGPMAIDLLASFFDVLSCISIDGPMSHWHIGFILRGTFKYSQCYEWSVILGFWNCSIHPSMKGGVSAARVSKLCIYI